MKTITEFSGAVLREAAKVWRSHRPDTIPDEIGDNDDTIPTLPALAEVAAEAAPEAEAPPTEAPATEAAPEGEAPAAAEAAPPAPAPPPSTIPPAAAEAIGAAVGLQGDRLMRLLDALEVVGDKLEQVKRVVVCGAENPPPKAKKRGELFYLVDYMPRPEKVDTRRGRGREGGRDERGGRPRSGGGGPGGARGRGPGDDRRDREREPPRSEVPAAGAGWRLQRAPAEPGDRRDRGKGGRGPRRGGPKRDGGGRRPGQPRGSRPGAKP